MTGKGSLNWGFSAGICALAIVATTACAQPDQPEGSRASTAQSPLTADTQRGVLSFNAVLAESFPAVVRVVAIGRSPDGGGEGVIGSGSGVIVDAEQGRLLTNEHVVSSATSLQVQLADGRTLDAEVIGTDSATDIALIEVSAENLSAIRRSESRDVRVGDLVFAVGYPLGLEQTLTMGVVSGLGRSGIGDGLEDYIQTDAPINAGNSGGALLDSNGRLIGINTAILSRTGGNIGIGFAVPVDMAIAIAEQLGENGSVERGRVGISIAPVTAERARQSGFGRTRGALVSGVEAGSPAEEAGLQEGDIITQVGDRAIATPGNLSSVVGTARPGDTLEFDFVREGEQRQVSVRVGQRQREQTAQASASSVEQGQFLGAAIRDLQRNDPFPQGAKGVVVTTVPQNSQAAQRGLQAGDLIVAINGQQVSSADQLATRLSELQGPLQIVIARGNSLLPLSFRN